MPVAPGRSVAILVEVAARNQLLRSRGLHAARDLRGASMRSAARGGPAASSTTRTKRNTSREARGEPGEGGREGRPRGCRQAASPGRGEPVHHPDRAVGIGQVAGDSGAGGPRLLLRRQPADDPDSHAGRRCRSSRRRHLRRCALVVDVREGDFLSSFPQVFRSLRRMPRLNPLLIFLEASHDGPRAPVQRDAPAASRWRTARSVSEGIRAERAQARRDPRAGRRDRRHLRHDRPRAAAVLHGPRRRETRAGRAGGHAAQLRVQVRRCPWTPTASSTSAACRTRTSCRRCARRPAATGRSCPVHGASEPVTARVHRHG